MSNRKSSFGSNRFARVSGYTVIALAAAALIGCGGGGGGGDAAPAATVVDTPTKTAQSVKITSVTIGSVNIDGATVNPDEPALVTVNYDAGGTQGAASMAVTCGNAAVTTTVATSSISKVDFTHNPWPVGPCTWTATVSAAGYTSATSSGSFTVKLPVASYKADLFITLDGEIGQSLYANGTFTDKLLVNGTQYSKMMDCTMVYVSDEVLYKSDTGLPVARCFDETNVQRDVEVDVVTGKLSRTVVTPASVVTHSTGYTPSARFAAQGVSRLGKYSISQLNPSDVHYVTDTGVMVHWVAPNGDFSRSYQVNNLAPNSGDPYKGYKGFVSVSN